MTANNLLGMGFKKQEWRGGFWYELKVRNHLFLTNDNIYNKGKDVWHIGYEDTKVEMDTFWFNLNLSDVEDFRVIHKVITGELPKNTPKQ